MSDNPAFPDADKTAPGGMSRPALTTELVDEHGWMEDVAKGLSWPAAINAVVKARAKAEREAPAEPAPLFIGMPGTKDYIFDGHRGTGPSAAERWIACTASLAATRLFLETLTPNQQAEFAKSNLAARQGTTAHAVGETQARVLLGEITAEEAEATLLELSIMPETDDEAYDEEMEGYVSEYVDLVRQYIDTGCEVMVEQRVEAVVELMTVDSDGDPDLHTLTGSLDMGVIPTPEEPVLTVVDLKYGEGIDVGVEENPQIRIYALGLLALVVEKYGEIPEWLVDVDYIIAQPRLGGIKTWTEKVDDLLDWRDEVLSKALTEALGGQKSGAAFNPGEVQCQWCPARGGCPALTEQRVAEAADLFDEMVEGIEDISLLDDERLAVLYSQARGIADITASLKDEAQRRLYRGHTLPGFQLVSYTPPRKWHGDAEDEIAGLLHEGSITDEEYAALHKPNALLTPTQALKVLEAKAALLDDIIEAPAKRPVIAPEGDRRKTWEGRAPEDMFDNEDE